MLTFVNTIVTSDVVIIFEDCFSFSDNLPSLFVQSSAIPYFPLLPCGGKNEYVRLVNIPIIHLKHHIIKTVYSLFSLL